MGIASTLVGKDSGEVELHLRVVLLLDHLQEDGVDGDVAVDADGEGAWPEQHRGLAGDLDGRVQLHVAARDVGEDSAGAVRELDAVKARREVEQAAWGGGLLAGVEAGGAEVRAAVEDGDGGGPVAHRHDVGVGGVHGEGEADVQRRRRAEVEGGQADGDELEPRVPGTAQHQRRGGGRRRRARERRAPAPPPVRRRGRRAAHGVSNAREVAGGPCWEAWSGGGGGLLLLCVGEGFGDGDLIHTWLLTLIREPTVCFASESNFQEMANHWWRFFQDPNYKGTSVVQYTTVPRSELLQQCTRELTHSLD